MKKATWLPGSVLSRVLPVLLALCLVGFQLPGKALAADCSHGILLQGFGWNSMTRGVPSKWFQLVGERAKDIADCGFTLIWLPPVSRSVSPQGYMPGDYYDLGTPNSPTFYGDLEQLKKCVQSLHAAGVKVLADIVVNHRCAGQQDSNGIWNIFHFASGKAEWEQWAVCRGEYGGTGNGDSGENYPAAPDIDHTNQKVQESIVEWLQWMKKLGFDGWRYDYCRGYGPQFVSLYDQKSGSAFSVGEIWNDMVFSGSSLNYDQNRHRQQLCDWIDKAGSAYAFDFTTKGILQVAVNGEYGRLRDSQGKASGLIGWYPKRAVTFLDNHDTGSQQNHWPFPGGKIMQGYAYILTHPGVPSVFWEHLYDWNLKTPIKKLMDIRKTYGLGSESKLDIVKAEQGLYAAVIDGKVAVKLGWVDWSPDSSFKLLTSGEQFAVWGKAPAARKK